MICELKPEDAHEYVVLRNTMDRSISPSIEHHLASDIFEALQQANDHYNDKKDSWAQRLLRLFGRGMKVPSYLVVVGFDHENPIHSSYVSSNNNHPSEGRRFHELDLKQRLGLGNGKPLVLDNRGEITHVAPKMNMPGFNCKPDNNGRAISRSIDGSCVYTMNDGAINRYDDGKLTFSTSRINEVLADMPLEDRRAIIGGMESPRDVPFRIGWDHSESRGIEYCLSS